MASLVKPWVVRYRDRNGKGDIVPKDTPGSKKVKERADKWYAQVKDPATGKWKRYPLATDKQVAKAMLGDIVRELEKGNAGMLDLHRKVKQAPIAESVKLYLTDLAEQGRSQRYIQQTERLVNTVIKGCDSKVLNDLTGDKLDAFLTGLTCSARTKNTYRQAALGMFNFLVRKKKLADNPLRLTTKRIGEIKRKRRAEKPENLQKLLDAARQRPLMEALTIRKGRRKGELGASVKPEDRERLERIGRHRALLYLTAIHTGCRLGTLRRLRVCDLDLASSGAAMYLPGAIMKNGKDFAQRLRADLVAELSGWIKDTARSDTDLVFDVPTYSQMSKLLKKDLKRAGIPYRDAKGRVFDFHAFRKCKGSFLRQAKVDPSVSMQQLGHSDIRLTMQVYNDEELLPCDEALHATPNLSIRPAV